MTRPLLRKHERAPLALEVHYRTAGSFLVSYSVNLSRGGLFLETTEVLPVGTRIGVRFSVPGMSITVETDATVMWVREVKSEVGLPAGLGLKFESLEEQLGVVIDRLMERFRGMRFLAIAADMQAQDRLARQLRSVLTAEIVQATPAQILIEGLGSRVDLVLVDLDSTGVEGLDSIRRAVSGASPPLPAVAVSRQPELRTAALDAGAEAALENPPPFELLRQRILDALGKPIQGRAE